MASETTNEDDRPEGSHERRECMPCRGSGRLISRLGGEAKEVTCPWCQGGGVHLQEIDAQAGWPTEEQPPAAVAPEADPQAEDAAAS